ncbi:MAG: hypothetical protein LBP21_06640 [Synergistaceae bacterium]|jgi:hypothetical protein|nr:hypothetical protein [Synergistaceae bacterium]
MNVTSMLSQGYLQPSQKVLNDIKKQGEAASLAMQEQQVLAQERALKAKSAGSKVSTLYRYSIGPNGRRYITGAEVTIAGDEQAIDRVPGGVKHENIAPRESAGNPRTDLKAEKAERTDNTLPFPGELEDSERAAIQELKQIEQEVIAHEAAHQAAGGRFAGAVSYSYTQGPDGKRYITGGEVPINVPPSSDPEQAIRDMEQVQRAALAPGNPSGQDRSVAAAAAAAAAQARQQLLVSKAKEASSFGSSESSSREFKTGAASVQAGLRFEDIRSQNIPQNESNIESQNDSSSSAEPIDAYSRHASKQGFWSWGRGFEPIAAKEVKPRFDLAA